MFCIISQPNVQCGRTMRTESMITRSQDPTRRVVKMCAHVFPCTLRLVGYCDVSVISACALNRTDTKYKVNVFHNCMRFGRI
jgi:hypothetical protein